MNSKLNTELDKMILSASGWRKVFGEHEESHNTYIKPEDKLIVAGVALVFYNYLAKKNNVPTKVAPLICTACDSRPTGNDISEAIIKTLISLGCQVRHLGICAAPEIMSYVKMRAEVAGFIYISASHNPIGYNGIKFGVSDGAVLGGEGSTEMIKEFKTLMSDSKTTEKLTKLIETASLQTFAQVIEEKEKWKKESFKTYLDFNLSICGYKSNTSINSDSFEIGIVEDFNGSARCTSIDKEFFKTLGLKTTFLNTTAGEIPSPILPEGENLSHCRKALENAYEKDSAFILGLMPDCDGDRGNLVFINSNTKKAEILKAQQVFALTCLAELSYITETNMANGKKIAIAVNGPTSLVIDKIANSFNATVFRAEVGEANIVNLSKKLSEDGWFVRYLGEGSNGGNITLPATVRDPLNTVGAVVRYLKNSLAKEKNLSPVEIFNKMIKTIPPFTTTETEDSLAKMKIKTKDHGVLKENYEKIFIRQWQEKKDYLKKEAGITNFQEINYMGREAVAGDGKKARQLCNCYQGGLKILFTDDTGYHKGFIWMRGSGTEPIFRLMADTEGENNLLERFLINWQRQMVEEADSL